MNKCRWLDRRRRRCVLGAALLVMVGGFWAGCGAAVLGVISQGQAVEGFSIAITVERFQLAEPPSPAATTSLHAVPMRGRAPFTYQWSVTDANGTQIDALLDALSGPDVSLTAGDALGPYEVTCRARDAAGADAVARVVIQVGATGGLDISTDRYGVLAGGGPGGQTTIRLTLPTAAVEPVDVSWTVTAPDGNVDNERLTIADPQAPVFTSTDRVGSYVLTATVVDDLGSQFTESAIVVVGEALGVDVVASRASVLPGGGMSGMATLLATPIGGTEPYSFDWEVVGPDGSLRNELLWDTAVRSPTFESGGDAGPFLVRCAVTDAAGAVLLGSTTIAVGSQVGVDVTADRLALPVGGESAALVADVRGGREPVMLNWVVSGPGGAAASDLLSSTTAAQVIFGPAGDSGSYVIRCTASDADGVTATDSLVLAVGGNLGVAISTDATSLAVGGSALTGTAQLNAQVYGGQPPYGYVWQVTGPSGVTTPERLSSVTSGNPTFASGSEVGAYELVCTVTDAAGVTAVDTLVISVGQPLNVDVMADKQTLLVGGGVSGQAQIITTVIGGAPPYTYAWSATSPNDADPLARLSSTSAPAPVFTSSALATSYQFTLTTTDALGVAFVESVELTVTDAAGAPGQGLSADVSISRTPVPPFGETALLSTAVTGGTAPYSYAWTVTAPDGTTDNTRLDSTTAADVTFTSGGTQGTYRVRCTVTDDAGSQFTDSVQLNVSDSFNLDVTAAVSEAAPGAAVNLIADRTGGVADFTFSWTSVDEADVPAGTFATGSTGPGTASQTAADDVTNTWTAPSGTGSLGTYRIQVVLTDAIGNTSTDSVQVVVQMPLSLNLSADNTFVPPSTLVTLLADQTGGEPPYDYAWAAEDSAGNPAGTFGTGSAGVGAAAVTDVAGDGTNTWSAAAEDTYTITCTVTDNTGQMFVDSIPVVVTTQQAFALNVSGDTVVLGPGETINLTGDQTGGRATFTYAWSALDPGDNPAGTFGADTQVGLAGDASNTWTAPTGAGVAGTYRIACTVTDSVGRTATDGMLVEVGTVVIQNTFVDPAAAANDSVRAITPLAAAANAYPGQTLTDAQLTDPGEPRDLAFLITDANQSVTSGSVEIVGVDAQGNTRSETINFTRVGGGNITFNSGGTFVHIDEVNIYDFSSLNPIADLVSIGIGNKFGLTSVLATASDVVYTNEGGTYYTSGFTVDATAGEQGVTFVNDPNGARDYTVVFRVR